MRLKTSYGEIDVVVAEGMGALSGHFMLGGAYFHLSSFFQIGAPEKYLVTGYEGASIEQRRNRLGRGEGATPEAAVEACVDDYLGTMRKLRDSCDERIARFPEVGAPPRPRRYLVQVCLEREDLYRTVSEDDLAALRAIEDLEERRRALVRLSEPARVGSSGEVELEIVPHDPDSWRELWEDLDDG